MLGGHLDTASLLLSQEVFEARGGEGEGLPPQPHQVGILQPGVVEAVLDGGTRPAAKTHRVLFFIELCSVNKHVFSKVSKNWF